MASRYVCWRVLINSLVKYIQKLVVFACNHGEGMLCLWWSWLETQDRRSWWKAEGNSRTRHWGVGGPLPGVEELTNMR